ncbi:MAG: hypothetical protein V7731_24735 [Amphritea sp.]
MRDQDKDLELPSFGPAEWDPNAAGGKKQGSQQSNGSESVASGASGGAGVRDNVRSAPASGGGLTFLIMLLLAAAVGGMAYWGYMQHQQLLAQDESQRTLEQKVLELQQLLQVAESSATQTGESLLDNVKKQSAAAAVKDKQLDSEIAKLWAIAHQRNTPKIAELEKQLAATRTAAKDQEKQLTASRAAAKEQDKQAKSSAAAQDKRIKALAASLKTQEQANKKTASGLAAIKNADSGLATVNKNMASLRAEIQVLEESLELQQAEHKRLLSGFAEQITALQSNGNASVGLERRVRVNEQAVRAIDGSRIQLNKELLQIRQKLNNMQLKVEQLQ